MSAKTDREANAALAETKAEAKADAETKAEAKAAAARDPVDSLSAATLSDANKELATQLLSLQTAQAETITAITEMAQKVVDAKGEPAAVLAQAQPLSHLLGVLAASAQAVTEAAGVVKAADAGLKAK